MPARSEFPLAYHITWGTYGTRLHGDERGTVDRAMNQFGHPIIGKENDWQRMEAKSLRFPPRLLTFEQRSFAEKTVPEICQRGGWEYIVSAAAIDHVHNVFRAQADGREVRKWLKRWLSESMSKRWLLLPDQVWWAECGSVKWVWTEDYYKQVVDYVTRQRTEK